METKYPTLRRPKRKLCYITEKERISNDWKQPLTQEDVDKIFDDIDVGTLDLYPTSVTLQSSNSGTSQSEISNSSVPQGKLPAENPPGLQVTSHSPFKPVTRSKITNDPDDCVFLPATRSSYPKSHIDLDIPFKAHTPVKTSSPIEQIMNKKNIKKTVDGNGSAVSPILFNCEDEAVEEPDKNPPSTQKPDFNRRVTENSHDGEMGIPPSRAAQAKKATPKKVKALCSQDGTKSCALAVRRKPEGSAPENIAASVHKQPLVELSSRVGKDMSAFLQKITQTVQSKPTKKSTVKASPLPPEPEDDFLILEDDAPLWFSIPSKNATKKGQKLSKPSSTDKESLTERESKDSLTDPPQETPETANNEPESQAVIPKTNVKDSLPIPEDCPVDPMEQQKSKKNKRQKKVSSKDMVEDPVRTASAVAENPSQKTEPTKQKSTGRNNFKDGNEITPRKRSDTLKEVVSVADDVYEEPNQEPAQTEDQGSFSDKEIAILKVNGKTKPNKQAANSEEHSSKDDNNLCKRRRKPTGQWWLTSQNAEEAENPLPPKKSKQNSTKEPSTTAPTVQAKKDKADKKKSQKQPALASSSLANQPKESKCKQTKTRKTKGKNQKETDEIIDTAEAKEEQQFPDQDLNQEDSSPLVFTHRDVSINSGGEVFQKVYGYSSSEKTSVTSTAAEDRLWEVEPAKRRRKPPSQWWEVNNAAGVLESTSSRPQQLHHKEPKPKKELEKQPNPGLGTPKKGNEAAGSKPPGGAPVPSLKPPSKLKTVKCSLPTFNNTSGVGTTSVVTNRDAHQSNKRNITPRPAEKDAEFISPALFSSDKDVLCGVVGKRSGTQLNHKTLQDRKCQSDGTPKVLRSGPSSMLEMEKYEYDDVDLSSSRVQIVLSASDLCSPPLKPLTLHSKDKSDLTEWFQSLWSSTADDDAVVTPDQFQWYFYQDRALGIQADLNSTSICSGKILMGSYMKKPLWVDHSATTVFNLLTSSVSVTVDGRVSRYSPGQAFIVECGRAYSIHNPNALPAVLYFTRISAESSD
ncbi:proteoglycan 4 [Nematolebias whitei]|uniref:proteoglycan 4 n=1 Tax=Nematolebias whitei TaxID=451745 RepID=UPI00189BBA41|nr:proteoglycan 4 [Nematolebias whitei]